MKRIYRKYIVVKGIVQGVGFRPFVYRIASQCGLYGWVKNSGSGVYIDIEGTKEQLEKFLQLLTKEAPPLSHIQQILIEDQEPAFYTHFMIESSEEKASPRTWISPDMAICEACERELKEEGNPRYLYPFTNCTHCGPRFTIVQSLPYDRRMTTMHPFTLCPQCKKEYEDPSDRRFHAQPNACPDCGPVVWLADGSGEKIPLENRDVFPYTRELLKQGKIIAVKGLGGFHLVCDAKHPEAVDTLRRRKRRPSKPLAVMMKSLEVAKEYCQVNSIEERILTGNKKPILLLNKQQNPLPESVAPNQKSLGVMLPYTPLHHLLFDQELEALVMTSANRSGQPMVYQNQEALEKLRDIADGFLLHNREIHIPIEDSVSRVILGEERVLRRGRGYAPSPVSVEGVETFLACGAQLKNSFCIASKDVGYLSPFIGDLDSMETFSHYERMIEHFKNLYGLEPTVIAHDMHPDLLSTSYAKQTQAELLGIQHHHAHAVSCMAENHIHHPVVALVFDGTGYGEDGKIWGGEFFIADRASYKRVGHLQEIGMPGGERAIQEPWRMALSYLQEAFGKEMDFSHISCLQNRAYKPILALLERKTLFPRTTSMGRLFDAVAALIGFDHVVRYEGEAAIFLEEITEEAEGLYPYHLMEQEQKWVLQTTGIIRGVVEDLQKGVRIPMIARKFHNTVIAFSVELCKRISSFYHIKDVVLSGGVFQNEILLKGLYQALCDQGFHVYTHKQIPCNDGGIALGQLKIAEQIIKERTKCV